jgi:hypothetical protein
MHFYKDAHCDELNAARSSCMEDNLAYLQANIRYLLDLDAGQLDHQLAEILATMSVIVSQIESSRQN